MEGEKDATNLNLMKSQNSARKNPKLWGPVEFIKSINVFKRSWGSGGAELSKVSKATKPLISYAEKPRPRHPGIV